MITKIFSVYDTKAETYMQPFHAPTTGSAIRSISDCLSDSSHPFAKHPTDYMLFELGSYDDSSASFTLLADKVCLGSLLDYKA